jgi:hypothetical protein
MNSIIAISLVYACMGLMLIWLAYKWNIRAIEAEKRECEAIEGRERFRKIVVNLMRDNAELTGQLREARYAKREWTVDI